MCSNRARLGGPRRVKKGLSRIGASAHISIAVELPRYPWVVAAWRAGGSREIREGQKEENVARKIARRAVARRAVKRRAVKRALVKRAVKRRALKRALVKRAVRRAVIARALAQRMGEGSTQ